MYLLFIILYPNTRESPEQKAYRKKKKSEKFTRTETNHRVMTKAQRAMWEREVEEAPRIITEMTRSEWREKENIEFIQNNEDFELIVEEISPSPKKGKNPNGAVPRFSIMASSPNSSSISMYSSGNCSLLQPTSRYSIGLTPENAVRSNRSSRSSRRPSPLQLSFDQNRTTREYY